MKRFWVSWTQPTNDPRPITYPPNEAILGWWISGYNTEDEAVICAVVQVAKEIEVRKAIMQDWPEVAGIEAFRFIEEKPSDFKPGERFVVDEDWMIKRFNSSSS